MPLLRSILAGFVGLIVASLVVMLVESINSVLYPFPPGFDMNDRAAIAAFVKTMPPVAFVAVWFGWALGGFTGTWLARKLTPSGSNRPALTVAVIFFLFCAFNMAMIPSPLPFIVASVITTPLACYAGLTLANRRR
jgi:hypothetical protein